MYVHEPWEQGLNGGHSILNFSFQEIGEEFVEFLEKELNITDQNGDYETPQGENASNFSGRETPNSSSNPGEASKGSVEDNLEEIEATLAQLKKELGL